MSIKNFSFRYFGKWLASVFNPPYQLTLSDTLIDKENGFVTYIFKQYGLHEYVRVTYSDIISNTDLLHAINPVNLMDIHLAEHERKVRFNETRVSEILRGGRFRLSRGDVTEEYTAEYIVNNIDMFAHVCPTDLCSIAYTAGFRKGRNLSKEISNVAATSEREEVTRDCQDNVFELRRGEKL